MFDIHVRSRLFTLEAQGSPNLSYCSMVTMSENTCQNRIEQLMGNPFVLHADPYYVVLTEECLSSLYDAYTNDSLLDTLETQLGNLGLILEGKDYVLPESLYVLFLSPFNPDAPIKYWRTPDTSEKKGNRKKSHAKEERIGKTEKKAASSKEESPKVDPVPPAEMIPQNPGIALPTSEKHEGEQQLTEEELAATGAFKMYKRSVCVAPDVERLIVANYPETSLEEIMGRYGLTVQKIGANRFNTLKAKYGKLKGKDPLLYCDAPECSAYTAEVLSAYSSHPYVKKCTEGSIVLNERFMDEAHRIALPIHKLLRTFCIDPGLFSFEERTRLAQDIREWTPSPIREPGLDEVMNCSAILEQVYYNRLCVLEASFDATLAKYRDALQGMTQREKKDLFMAIHEMPKDTNGKYSLSGILDALGIPRTTFYSVLENEAYGQATQEKEEQDLRDIELIKKVMAHRGFKKGSRQIYMMMEEIVGERFGLQKIQRLMKKFNIESGIREPNEAKRRMAGYMKGRVKPNLLMRTFRMHRPNEVRLSDVTYLSYGTGSERAYCSASIDPVTSKVAAINVSKNNDLDLAMETLRLLQEDAQLEGVLLHTDRGCLYLSRAFQEEAEKIGLLQSMSKLGNCWDNSPQESFNGNLKQEVDFSACETIEEVEKRVKEYAEYFNKERHIWNRRKMTPLQYEEYLLSLSEEEWAVYLEDRQSEYNDMKAKASMKAKARYKDLGV